MPATPAARVVGIVACSAEGSALCYRTICTEGARRLGGHGHPELVMHGHSLADYVACLDRNDLAGVAELMLSSAHKLAAAGAQLLICPDNTIHQALPLLNGRSPLPWLHIAEEVADAAVQRGFRRLALTGTRWLVDSAVYPDALAARGLVCVKPTPEDRDAINRVIMDELVHGRCSAAGVQTFQQVIGRLQQQGCDAVVLGCTEIPLIIDDGTSPLPILDSTRLLARAALRWAIEGVAAATALVGTASPPSGA